MGGATQDFKCPLSMRPFTNPMTSYVFLHIDALVNESLTIITGFFSKTCKHSFSGDALREYLKNQRGQQATCPSTGCRRQVMLADFYPDQALAAKTKAFVRRQARREAEEQVDAEMIID